MHARAKIGPFLQALFNTERGKKAMSLRHVQLDCPDMRSQCRVDRVADEPGVQARSACGTELGR
jgi:hypothetical protein